MSTATRDEVAPWWDPAKYEAHLRRVLDIAGLDVTEIVLPTSRHVLVGKMRLHYLDWGGAPGKPIMLMLHGGGLNAHTWDVVSLSLRSEYHCIALDLRGHGESEWSRSMEYTVPIHQHDVLGFMDNLGIDRCIIVGMSLGGIVGLSIAVEHKQRMRALVLVDVGPVPLPDGVQRIEGFMRRATGFTSMEQAIDTAMEFNPRRSRTLLSWTLERNLMRMPDGTYTWKYDRRNRMNDDYVDTITGRARELAQLAHTVECETLLVYGEDSEVVSADSAAEFIARVPRGRAVGVPNAGHTVQGDNPAALLAHVRAFTAGLSEEDDDGR